MFAGSVHFVNDSDYHHIFCGDLQSLTDCLFTGVITGGANVSYLPIKHETSSTIRSWIVKYIVRLRISDIRNFGKVFLL